MRLFTQRERRALSFLLALLVIGLLVRQWRSINARPSEKDVAERAAALQEFTAGVERFTSEADSTSVRLWAYGLHRPVDINSASNDDLQALPGIGPVLAKKIVDYRQKNGYFQTVQDLMNISGIGPKSMARLEGLIIITHATAKKKGLSIEQ